MHARIYYNHDHTAAFEIDKAVIRATLALTSAEKRHLRHFDKIFASTNELHAKQNIILQQMLLVDGTHLYPTQNMAIED